ncbi:hypothetical protein ACQKJG_18130 [Priestia megaterium]|uniref:hypothetical protein n=1 Tax=Priestia megaterium TaxID=1404 RepID=UPI003CFE2680
MEKIMLYLRVSWICMMVFDFYLVGIGAYSGHVSLFVVFASLIMIYVNWTYNPVFHELLEKWKIKK